MSPSPVLSVIYCVGKLDGTICNLFLFSDLLKMNQELTKERDDLLTTVESLREKLNKAIATQQEIEAQRDSASENISQVNKWQILIDSRMSCNVLLIRFSHQW